MRKCQLTISRGARDTRQADDRQAGQEPEPMPAGPLHRKDGVEQCAD